MKNEEEICVPCLEWFEKKVCEKLGNPELCKQIIKEFEDGKIDAEGLIRKIEESFSKEELDKALKEASEEAEASDSI